MIRHGFMAICWLVLVGATVVFFVGSCRRQSECEAKGGRWLGGYWVCVKEIE